MLSHNHELTRLIVLDAHNRVKHNGKRHTLAKVRSEYWIPKGRSFVEKVLHKCTVCRKFNARPYDYPKSPDLPAVRLNDHASFSGIRVDYSGALYSETASVGVP